MSTGGLQVGGGALARALHSREVSHGLRLRARRTLRIIFGACCSSLQRKDSREKKGNPSLTWAIIPDLSMNIQLSNLKGRNSDIFCPLSMRLEMMWEIKRSLYKIGGRRGGE